jgi:3'-phosphoadenosine 5'-phosphosulfate (PAPS) 3'-phosphatase
MVRWRSVYLLYSASAARAMTTVSPAQVNLLELASAAVACTVQASNSIRTLIENKNTRVKKDGTFVTDADGLAQGVICKAIQGVSRDIKIIGEESPEEMARHFIEDDLDENILQRTRQEIQLRYAKQTTDRLPLGSMEYDELTGDQLTDYMVDASRITVIVDPLDGTNSYAKGEYDCVSILIGIILDDKPYFGVVGKPFGYTGLPCILGTECVTIYGGPMIHGVYIAGGQAVVKQQISDTLPCAVISSSRSKGVVRDFCVYLGEQGLVSPDPMLISGAGEKSLRLILQRENEALWFFPKPGTSLWDVAAPDALLRALGGKMSDKYGNEMDYSQKETENVNGVVACIDAKLHAECIRLFNEGDWSNRTD